MDLIVVWSKNLRVTDLPITVSTLEIVLIIVILEYANNAFTVVKKSVIIQESHQIHVDDPVVDIKRVDCSAAS